MVQKSLKTPLRNIKMALYLCPRLVGWPTHECQNCSSKAQFSSKSGGKIAEECKDNSRTLFFFALEDFFERNLTPGSCMSPTNDYSTTRLHSAAGFY